MDAWTRMFGAMSMATKQRMCGLDQMQVSGAKPPSCGCSGWAPLRAGAAVDGAQTGDTGAPDRQSTAALSCPSPLRTTPHTITARRSTRGTIP